MYCVNGKPRSSLFIESTDSMIIRTYAHADAYTHANACTHAQCRVIIISLQLYASSIYKIICHEMNLQVYFRLYISLQFFRFPPRVRIYGLHARLLLIINHSNIRILLLPHTIATQVMCMGSTLLMLVSQATPISPKEIGLDNFASRVRVAHPRFSWRVKW